MTDKSSYKHILKSTSLFGSVQVVQVLSTIIKGKFVAILLGTVGMGISSLLVSSIAMLQTISGLGLNFSAVREISQAQESGDSEKLSRTIIICKRWLFVSALLGGASLILISPFLSKYVFGNYEYTWHFIFLSIVVVLTTLGIGYQTLLQGTRKLKDIAKSSAFGSILSIFTSIPFYYIWGVKGIVPALIVAALTTFSLNYFYAKRIKLTKVNITFKETANEGTDMVKLGVVMMITNLIGVLTTFIIIAYIKRTGSLSDVGLYQGGISLTTQYVGLIFSAMIVDYFPRLSAINKDEFKVRELANQQSEIMLLIITPLLITLIITAPLIIRILLSKEFVPLVNFIRCIAIGLLFQAAAHSMALISFAKGDRKTFLILSIIGNALLILSSILGYKLYGLNGISILFIFQAILCFIIVFITAYKKYNYWMSKSFIKIFSLGIILISLIYLLVVIAPSQYGFPISVLFLCISIFYSIRKLNKLIGLLELYNNFIKKYYKKQ